MDVYRGDRHGVGRVELVPGVVVGLAVVAVRGGAGLLDRLAEEPVYSDPVGVVVPGIFAVRALGAGETKVAKSLRTGHRRDDPRPLDVGHGPGYPGKVRAVRLGGADCVASPVERREALAR